MKKLSLLLIALASMLAVNAVPTLNYQGGTKATYPWSSDQAMYNDMTAIADAIAGNTRPWVSLTDLKND